MNHIISLYPRTRSLLSHEESNDIRRILEVDLSNDVLNLVFTPRPSSGRPFPRERGALESIYGTPDGGPYEFLGDAVFEVFLLMAIPSDVLVSTNTFTLIGSVRSADVQNRLFEQLGLNGYVMIDRAASYIGSDISKTTEFYIMKVAGDVFEAIVGAVFLYYRNNRTDPYVAMHEWMMRIFPSISNIITEYAKKYPRQEKSKYSPYVIEDATRFYNIMLRDTVPQINVPLNVLTSIFYPRVSHLDIGVRNLDLYPTMYRVFGYTLFKMYVTEVLYPFDHIRGTVIRPDIMHVIRETVSDNANMRRIIAMSLYQYAIMSDVGLADSLATLLGVVFQSNRDTFGIVRTLLDTIFRFRIICANALTASNGIVADIALQTERNVNVEIASNANNIAASQVNDILALTPIPFRQVQLQPLDHLIRLLVTPHGQFLNEDIILPVNGNPQEMTDNWLYATIGRHVYDVLARYYNGGGNILADSSIRIMMSDIVPPDEPINIRIMRNYPDVNVSIVLGIIGAQFMEGGRNMILTNDTFYELSRQWQIDNREPHRIQRGEILRFLGQEFYSEFLNRYNFRHHLNLGRSVLKLLVSNIVLDPNRGEIKAMEIIVDAVTTDSSMAIFVSDVDAFLTLLAEVFHPEKFNDLMENFNSFIPVRQIANESIAAVNTMINNGRKRDDINTYISSVMRRIHGSMPTESSIQSRINRTQLSLSKNEAAQRIERNRTRIQEERARALRHPNNETFQIQIGEAIRGREEAIARLSQDVDYQYYTDLLAQLEHQLIIARQHDVLAQFAQQYEQFTSGGRPSKMQRTRSPPRDSR